MKSALVGYTGFVGSNLMASRKFDAVYNSKNIKSAYGTRPDVLYFAGLRAEKFIANVFPEKDYFDIFTAMNNIKQINPKKLVLISTIDVYRSSINVDENSPMSKRGLLPYGENRLEFEEWVEEEFGDYLIVRLPALYGINLKKNFIYDMVNYIPEVLNSKKYRELLSKDQRLSDYYTQSEAGFLKCRNLSKEERRELKTIFEGVGFSALNFTDSRGLYQFFNLAHLWQHIHTALKQNIKKMNMAVEPVRIDELYRYVFGEEFVNEVLEIPPVQNFKTIYSDRLGGKDGYIVDKSIVLDEIKQFVHGAISERY